MIWQYLILGVILGGAVYYLWRVFFRRSSGGGCRGCGGACGPNPPLAGPPSLPPEQEGKQE